MTVLLKLATESERSMDELGFKILTLILFVSKIPEQFLGKFT
jgi:hypothetical protein